MKAVVQRCINGKVEVDHKVVGECPYGLLVFIGFTEGDNQEKIDWMARKIAHLRIFEDENDKMNLSVQEVKGSILSVSQFTLYGDATKSNRPSYSEAMKSEQAKKLYEQFNQALAQYTKVETGIFQAEMQVSFTNPGPVTILLKR